MGVEAAPECVDAGVRLVDPRVEPSCESVHLPVELVEPLVHPFEPLIDPIEAVIDAGEPGALQGEHRDDDPGERRQHAECRPGRGCVHRSTVAARSDSEEPPLVASFEPQTAGAHRA